MKQETRKLDQALMYLVFVFVTLLAFSLGVFAGKEFSDHEHYLITLKSEEYSAEKFASQIHRKEEPVAEDVISENMMAELAQQAVQEHEAQVAAEERKIASESSENPAAALERATDRVASGLTPSAQKPVDPRAPQRLPDAVGSMEVVYTVQVASYPSAEEATKHANKLVGQGFPAFQVPAEVKGKTWYRVSVGSFKNSSEASAFRTDFLSQSGEKDAIIQKIGR